jgi:glycosyltransferase involved in cell wall biosynthesis
LKHLPSVTVVICTRNRPEHLLACLAALKRQTYVRFDILVVENGPASDIHEICKRNGVGYLHEPAQGLSRARNAGTRAARGEIVAFIDDDALPEADWLERLLTAFDDETVGGVTGTIRYMKAYGESRFMSHEEALETFAHRPQAIFDRETRGWFSAACFGGIGDGSNMAFRRALFGRSVRFDERLGRGRLLEGGEDHVILVSFISRGHRVVHCPAAAVRHPFPADPDVRCAKQYRDLRTTIAYLIFLLVEFPEHRAEIAGFLVRAVLKRVSGIARSNAGRMPRGLALKAIVRGPLLYWRALQGWRVTSAASQPAPKPRFSRSL